MKLNVERHKKKKINQENDKNIASKRMRTKNKLINKCNKMKMDEIARKK